MNKPETQNDQQYFSSLSDLVNTIYKMDAKVTKLYDVVVGDKELGTKGHNKRLDDLELRVDRHESHKNKLMGVFIAAGFTFAYIWELTKNFFTRK